MIKIVILSGYVIIMIEVEKFDMHYVLQLRIIILLEYIYFFKIETCTVSYLSMKSINFRRMIIHQLRKKKKKRKENRVYFLITITRFPQLNCTLILLLQNQRNRTNTSILNIISSEYYPITINPRNQLSSVKRKRKKNQSTINNLLHSLSSSFPRFHSINFSLHISRERDRDHWKKTREA